MSGLLLVYCALIALGSYLGGWIPNFVKLGHRRTQMILSLVSGVMLGVALLNLLPRSISVLDNPQTTTAAVLAGLLFMFFMIRMFHFHHHDLGEPHEHPECDHEQHDHEIKRKDISWVGLAFGFAVHTIVDGIALAAATNQNLPETEHRLVGISVFLAIMLHKPLDALAITGLMAARGWNKSLRSLINLIFALMCPMGAILFALGISGFGDQQSYVIGLSMAFSAGVFLCISLGDLLPEVQFHSHDRLALSGVLLLGVAAAMAIELMPLLFR